MKLVMFILLFLIAGLAQAQTVNCNTATGTVAIPGTALTVTCPAGVGGTPTPPPTPPVTAGCSDSQLSSPINGKQLKRQCSVHMEVNPGPIASGNFPATDLGTILGGRDFPNYAYAGYSPTYTIQSGYYIALAFTPAKAGAVQLSANTSYGDGGIISLSTVPGAIATGSAGSICVLNRNGSNSLYFGTSAPYCAVKQGVTYYINMADIDLNGNNLCHGGKPNTCTDSLMSYAVYTSQ